MKGGGGMGALWVTRMVVTELKFDGVSNGGNQIINEDDHGNVMHFSRVCLEIAGRRTPQPS